MDKLKPVEIIYLIVALFLAIGTFGFIFSPDMLAENELLEVSSYNISEIVYDVSVINAASIGDFLEVKGIGEAKATAIVNYREALGGFTSVYQIGDLSAISDSLLEEIIEHFYGEKADASGDDLHNTQKVDEFPAYSVNSEDISEPYDTLSQDDMTTTGSETSSESRNRTYVEINYTDAETISRCLLIDISVAEEIVSIRERIHGYTYVWELTLCDSLTLETYEKISEFVIIS